MYNLVEFLSKIDFVSSKDRDKNCVYSIVPKLNVWDHSDGDCIHAGGDIDWLRGIFDQTEMMTM